MASAFLRLPLLAAWRREFADYTWAIFRRDLLAGLTVGAVALPLALAFGVAGGARDVWSHRIVEDNRRRTDLLER
jgi:SulP family sulfate permease